VARAEGSEEALLQVAVSNLPVSADGLVRMLADDPAEPGDVAAMERALDGLARLSLVFRLPDGTGWVHRWTSEGLAALRGEEGHHLRCNRAGRYRWWRVGNQSHALEDAVEAVRNHLAGRDFDAATAAARGCFDALRRFQRTAGIAALASEVLETLPVDHGSYAVVADEEASAHLALGWTGRAMERYEALLTLYRRRVEAEPDRADFQRDLSVSYERMGDLYSALGQGEKARESYQSSLTIRERLAAAEPDRADFQQDLALSYERFGDVHLENERRDEAEEAFSSALRIRQRLVDADPGRADYQVELVVPLARIGSIKGSAGRPELERALSILETLKSQGRLSPADEPKIEAVRSLLDRLE
jgi:tetratricopeptide (TPR) repeat protein